jgi:hypothetical protein
MKKFCVEWQITFFSSNQKLSKRMILFILFEEKNKRIDQPISNSEKHLHGNIQFRQTGVLICQILLLRSLFSLFFCNFFISLSLPFHLSFFVSVFLTFDVGLENV